MTAVRRETHRLVEGALPVPDNLDDGNSQWIEEAIYGHRFYNDQTPWFAIFAAHRGHRDFFRSLLGAEGWVLAEDRFSEGLEAGGMSIGHVSPGLPLGLGRRTAKS